MFTATAAEAEQSLPRIVSSEKREEKRSVALKFKRRAVEKIYTVCDLVFSSLPNWQYQWPAQAAVIHFAMQLLL